MPGEFNYFSKKIHAETHAKEKRKAQRLDASEDFLVEFKRGFSVSRIYIGYGVDLSTIGLLFSTFASALRKGEKLDLKLYFSPKFPGTRKAEIKAEVIRVYRTHPQGPYKIGCRMKFEPGSPSEEIIRQFVWWLRMDRSFSEQPSEEVSAAGTEARS